RRQGFVHVPGRRFRKPSGYVCGALALTAEREESEDQRGAGEEPKRQHTLLAALGLGLGLGLRLGRGFRRRLGHGFRLLRLCLFSARGLFGQGLFGRGFFGQGFFGGSLLGRLFFGEDFVRRVFQERLWHDGADRATRRDFGQHFGEQGLLARVHFGRRRLLVPVVVIVVTCPAANFGGLARQQGYNRVVHDALALDAKVVDDVAESRLPHMRSSQICIVCAGGSGGACGADLTSGTTQLADSNPTYLQMRNAPLSLSSKSPASSGRSEARKRIQASYSLSAWTAPSGS